MDAVGRLLEDLCRPGALERRLRDGEHSLKEYVEAEGRDLSPEAYSKLKKDIYRRVEAMLRSG
jgi:FKBP12-rapamycin complex-associated protein